MSQDFRDPQQAVGFAEEYAEQIIEKIWQYRDWGPANLMFLDCPREHLENVAFIFLHHYVAAECFGPGDLH